MKIPVLIPNIFNHPFTYKCSGINLKLGDYVEVPFGKSKKIGSVEKAIKDFANNNKISLEEKFKRFALLNVEK